jgi:phosphoglucosamine mutase
MLTKNGWLLGGETSGHIICKDLVSTGDGTIAALKVISSLLILEKDPSDILSNYTKMPQINNAIKVNNKDIVNDKDLLNLMKEIESDITVGRVLVRPSGTESKIRVMVEAPEEKVAEKFAKDICDLIKSKS